jgi:glycosyltransferase involved in cell wall biosynthesis
MNIGFISTRLAGNDGVSLETAKLVTVLRGMEHDCFYCAGELESGGPPGKLIPEMHFETDENRWIRAHAFGTTIAHPDLRARIERLRAAIKPQIEGFLKDYHIDLIITENVFAIPMQLSLALALADIIRDTGLRTIAHNHDYYWERDLYLTTCVQDILDAVFPPALPSITHAAINSLAQRDLKLRRGLDSVVLPNVFDYATPAPGVDDYNADFRAAVELADGDFYILQPVRIIRRKGLELAIETVARLDDPRCKMIFTHGDDVDRDYLNELEAQARAAGVDFRLVTGRVSTQRATINGQKVYTLWDAYVHADFVMYPSLYEGFGNALLETIYFKKPALVNRYSVYAADIGPLGFQFVEIDGAVTDEAVAQVRAILDHPDRGRQMAAHNYALAEQHFSYAALGRVLRTIV